MTAKPPDRRLVVNNFDDAVKELLDLLRDSDGTAEGKTTAFFFNGFFGLGASDVLRAIAELLKTTASDSSTKNHFGIIIHVDCSLWKSRRAMQRAIAEELNLRHLMPMFDKQDDEDDFRGVDDSSRAEITSIGAMIHEYLRNERFLMIFHYGGDEEIDLANCGVPPLLGPYDIRKLLWTNHGRFQLTHREQRLMSSFITPRVPVVWYRLEWCHVERCPKLRSLFTCHKEQWYHNFPNLKIFSACDLLMAHCIWSKGISSPSFRLSNGDSKPVVDCEKDWWDKLEWDGLEANHDPSLFKTRHSAYYKKTTPRGSLLR